MEAEFEGEMDRLPSTHVLLYHLLPMASPVPILKEQPLGPDIAGPRGSCDQFWILWPESVLVSGRRRAGAWGGSSELL